METLADAGQGLIFILIYNYKHIHSYYHGPPRVIKSVFADVQILASRKRLIMKGHIFSYICSNYVVKCSLGRKFIIFPDTNIIYWVLMT